MLDGIKSHRGTAIRPQRTGPVIDVLYSAAGNSADEAYYTLGIIGYDFEIGDTTLQRHPATGAERPATRVSSRRSATPTQRLPRQRGLPRGDGVLERQLRPAAVRARLRQRHDAAGRRRDRRTRVANVHAEDVRFTSNEAASIYYTTDGSTPTTASTEWKPTRARALPLPVAIAARRTLKWIAHRLQGQHVRGQVEVVPDRDRQADGRT